MAKKTIVERIEVDESNLYYQVHAARYRFAFERIRPRISLDIATGKGYGADMLQKATGCPVVGVDVDFPTLHEARSLFPNPNVSLVVADGAHLPFAAHAFGNVLSMETVEHIHNDTDFIRELARVLEPDGLCVLSTPNREYSEQESIVNPYHVREYSGAELLDLLTSAFRSVRLFQQGFSKTYYDQVKVYSDLIQDRKNRLNRFLRFGINAIYHPLRNLVPDKISNLMIHRWLKLSYPQPEPSQIVISEQPVETCQNFLAVCHGPQN